MDVNGTDEGCLCVEGTAGSTGVSLAMVASALGCKAHLALPDDAALEKSQLMTAYGQGRPCNLYRSLAYPLLIFDLTSTELHKGL